MLKAIGTIGFFLSLIGIGIMVDKDVLAPSHLLDRLEDLHTEAEAKVPTTVSQEQYDAIIKNYYDTGYSLAAQKQTDKLSRLLYDFENYINGPL